MWGHVSVQKDMCGIISKCVCDWWYMIVCACVCGSMTDGKGYATKVRLAEVA